MGKVRRAFVLAAPLLWSAPAAAEPNLGALEELGKRVFFDKISDPPVMSCATCHVPAYGWTGGSSVVNEGQVAIPGANPGTAGNRKPPSAAYAAFVPSFNAEVCTQQAPALACRGGVFWDGRASGQTIGDEVFKGCWELKEAFGEFLGPTADQALGPFANDVEQNVPDGNDNGLPGAEFVCRHVAAAPYAELYDLSWGESIDCEISGVGVSFKRIAVAISAWEHSAEVNSFSSKLDRALAHDCDRTPATFPLRRLTNKENLGHDLFYGITSALNPRGKDARCARCHNSKGSEADGTEPDQLYTDHGFHHLGLPPNHDIANFDPQHPDLGLAMHTAPADPARSRHAGSFRTPTLRNVAKRRGTKFVKTYMHNGYFKKLEDVVHFYNTATLKVDPVKCPPGTTAAQARERDCWPEPEVADPLPASAFGVFGNLGLNAREEAALVAYLKTLSDRETVRPPRAYHTLGAHMNGLTEPGLAQVHRWWVKPRRKRQRAF